VDKHYRDGLARALIFGKDLTTSAMVRMTAKLAEQYTIAGKVNLPADVAAHLQQVAWETAQKYARAEYC